MTLRNRYVTGIDIGSHMTRVVVCEYAPGTRFPTVVAIGKAPTQGIHHGYIINRTEARDSVRAAVQAAEQNLGSSIREITLAIGGMGLSARKITTTITLPSESAVTESDVSRLQTACEEVVLRDTSNIKPLHTIPVSFLLDGSATHGTPIGLSGSTMTGTCLCVSVLEHHFEDLVSVVNEVGCDVVDVVASPLATSMVVTDQRQRMVGCAIADIGAETVSLAVFERGNPISLEVFAIGSSDITNDIALGFQIGLDRAEKLKTKKDDDIQYPRTRIEEIVAARTEDIFELIGKHLERIGKFGLLPAGIVITGGGSALTSIEDMARVALRIHSRGAHIEATPSFKKRFPDASWYTAYGLCITALQYDQPLYRRHRLVKGLARDLKNSILSWIKEILP